MVRAVAEQEQQLRAALADVMHAAGVESARELLSTRSRVVQDFPRFVRVNTLLISKEKAVAQFQHDGFTLCQRKEQESNGARWGGMQTRQLKRGEFIEDEHLSDLLVFGPGTDLHDHALVEKAAVILQDKASCFPAHALAASQGSQVIDACAAPGNKTSHVAASLSGSGKVFAFDLNPRRLKLMKARLKQARAVNVEARMADFLKVSTDDPAYARVEFILLDPSCSGSGMWGTQGLSEEADEGADESRLQGLAEFQLQALLHAFKFPAVRRISYSTCSIHDEENEHVVEAALKADPRWKLQRCLPQWHRRGNPKIEGAENCVRVDPEGDMMNGFFVACFERDAPILAPMPDQTTKGTHKVDRSKNAPDSKYQKRKAMGWVSEPTAIDTEDSSTSTAAVVIKAPAKKKRKKNRQGIT